MVKNLKFSTGCWATIHTGIQETNCDDLHGVKREQVPDLLARVCSMEFGHTDALNVQIVNSSRCQKMDSIVRPFDNDLKPSPEGAVTGPWIFDPANRVDNNFVSGWFEPIY